MTPSGGSDTRARRWMVVSGDTEGSCPGFVRARTPEGAIKAWVGDHYDRTPIYVVPAEHIQLFSPAENPVTVWEETGLPDDD